MVFQLHGENKNGTIIRAENLGIADFNIVAILGKQFNYENIILRNDAKCAALCEKTYGSLKDFEDSIFICLGTGIRTEQYLWKESS
ncbi:MAG: ROK family protein [Clostridia bacterium]|nr:ROK family protein [Clostridia bacterium]